MATEVARGTTVFVGFFFFFFLQKQQGPALGVQAVDVAKYLLRHFVF